jgi:hypothetical protein
MKPAVDGREHVFGGVLLSVVSDPPQWSPPLMGGSTDFVEEVAAGAAGAAMEPAVDGREHMLTSEDGLADTVPQWSPPLMGGSTAMYRRVLRRAAWPQWSPPLMGGSTGRGIGNDAIAKYAAMEPAVDGREHRRPGTAMLSCSRAQWSPPLMGGST